MFYDKEKRLKNAKYIEKKKREILAFARIRDKQKICPVDGSKLEITCDNCELCEKFQEFIQKELNISFKCGRWKFIEREKMSEEFQKELTKKQFEGRKKNLNQNFIVGDAKNTII